MTARKNGIGTPPERDGMAADWRELRQATREIGRAIEQAWIIPAITHVLDPLAKFCLRRFGK